MLILSFIIFFHCWGIVWVLLFDHHYLVITSLSILQGKEGFTGPFILKNTKVFSCVEELGKILIRKLLNLTFNALNLFTIVDSFVNDGGKFLFKSIDLRGVTFQFNLLDTVSAKVIVIGATLISIG